MVETRHELGIGRDSAGQRQPIAHRAADFGASRAVVECTDFWRDRSD